MTGVVGWLVVVVVVLLQCLGVWSGLSGSLAAGFGIILGGGGGEAVGVAGLTVGAAGGQRGVAAPAVPAGRVSPAASVLHRRLEEKHRGG